ncbi:MAG: hypothetical protein L0287_18160 [Anaerolineae bacterium]|nr:hypothetical protein [Anaerolineae bacterium]
MKPKIKRLIVTRADHPRALEVEKIIELARQAGVESEAASPVESAFARALELSEKDGSIVLSVGSMFVTAEVMRAWKEYPHPFAPLPNWERGEGVRGGIK